MILQLASRHCKKIAGFYLFVFYLSIVLPLGARSMPVSRTSNYGGSGFMPAKRNMPAAPHAVVKKAAGETSTGAVEKKVGHGVRKEFIGGPSQPEMSSFKSVSADKLVNLFTGDFSYNIPLLDVGGYPINIYYDGGISPEQEASWVGLGWNINPGNINRNMRGIPDDFNGDDILEQEQQMKPNRTWGLNAGAGAELLGLKIPVTLEAGVAFNNYLGPSLNVGLRGSVSLFSIAKYNGAEKLSAGIGAKADFGIDLNSRSGASFSGGVSMAATVQKKHQSLNASLGVSTSYNSRSGIKALNISEQVFFNENQNHKEMVSNAYGSRGVGGRNSSSITFAKPSYMPSLRLPLTNTAWTARVQIGAGSWGFAADFESEIYGQQSEISSHDIVQKKPMVGYMYYQYADNRPDCIMDFTRYNDREVTPNTPVISVPQYTYDVFAIQGEGTGGNIRAYRNDIGYVRDKVTVSKDLNVSLGGDIDVPGHYGANLSIVKTPSTIGEWKNGNKLRGVLSYTKPAYGFGNVSFRNPGEATSSWDGRYDNIGGTKLVRYELGGSGHSPTVEPKLQVFDNDGQLTGTTIDQSQRYANITPRNSCSQVITMLTAREASEVGLEHDIRSYDNVDYIDLTARTLKYESVGRVSSYRKAHHISQINVTESDGKRYVYGLPVYNIRQKDFTFTVNNPGADIPDQVGIEKGWASTGSTLLNDNGRDGYVQITTTPAYAHSFLLSGILSTDYVDVTNNGITEDDLGTAAKFNYSRITEGSDTAFKWRSPHTPGNAANFNPELRSETKDDKGMISYGERESWYLHSVESKNMIAIFFLRTRFDGRGAATEYGGVSNNSLLRALDKISLYSKADVIKNGVKNAKPIKTVHFDYTHELCKGTPDNTNTSGETGKLTLKSIYFTYNGKERGVKNKYSFSYGGDENNPLYLPASADRWGSYKPAEQNPAGLKNSDYPFSVQDKNIINKNAGAWMLKQINLPSGAQIEVEYESDDYAYVQNKRAAVMMNVAGFGYTPLYSESSYKLYPFLFPSPVENDYVFIRVPEECNSLSEVKNKYLQGLTQLTFKIWVKMPKGPEYITCYASFEDKEGVGYGVDGTDKHIIWVKMNQLGKKSPLSMTTLEYLRQQLPGQAFKGYDVAGKPALKQVGDMLMGMMLSLRDAFNDPVNAFRKDGKARIADLTKCFVRLNDPDGYKYGGGHRVHSVILRDNWSAMTSQYTASYGQVYNYETTEEFNGTKRTISSGVASYEPSIGGEENPWQYMMEVKDDLPLGPTSYGAVEMPVLDAFFPAPVVGYSEVTVTSMHAGTSTAAKKSRSGIGKQVTEFYTAKDYPVYYSYTPFDQTSVKEFNQSSTKEYFNKYGYDFKAQSQGFLVATNDMHGKMKSQSSYAENDLKTRVNYTQNFYRNTGVNGLDDRFTFVNSYENYVSPGNIGIDIELMTDVREFSVKGNSRDLQGNLDWFYLVLVNFPVFTFWPINGTTENIYRAVTTTKVISYHAVLEKVVVIDKGSEVSTENLAYDEETGQVVVTRTKNEFNMPVYNTNYPAYWAYKGMGLASRNVGGTYSNIDFNDGKTSPTNSYYFESGDEIYITDPGTPAGCLESSSENVKMIWAVDKNKNTPTTLNIPADLVFVDREGKPYSRKGVSVLIVRSGRRNMLEQSISTITSMENPLTSGLMSFVGATKVINATAVEYKEKWQTDNDPFRRFTRKYDPYTCSYYYWEDPAGELEKNINPYRYGLLGNFHVSRSMVFYDGRKEEDILAKTNIAENGFLKNFTPYWVNYQGYMEADVNNKQWVLSSQVNRLNAKGLELETVDALAVPAAAQYGFNKSMPVAIASNAKPCEMFAEGFEDYGYSEALNHSQYVNYARKHIDFNGVGGSYLALTEGAGIKAHSGRYALGVNKGTTAVKSIPVQEFPGYDFPITYGHVVPKALGNTGCNFELLRKIPSNYVLYGWFPSFGNLSNSINFDLDNYSFKGKKVFVDHFWRSTQYFEVKQAGTYKFYTKMGYEAAIGIAEPMEISTKIYILDVNDPVEGSGGAFIRHAKQGEAGFTQPYSTCLKPGIYELRCDYTFTCDHNCTKEEYSCGVISYDVTTWFEDKSLISYKDVSMQNGCAYAIPAPATESMQNPQFSVSGNKKMLLSAWVRETCGDAANGIPCKEYTYTHSSIQVKFPNTPARNVTMHPVGSIIDGWQRIEGSFVTPEVLTNTETMQLCLVNSSDKEIYFDDIRIHPLDANMKSYVYDPVNLRLVAEFDENNYGAFYEYDEEGSLIRTKIETKEGIKTVTETRSALQKAIR